jgi:hypothetical protein
VAAAPPTHRSVHGRRLGLHAHARVVSRGSSGAGGSGALGHRAEEGVGGGGEEEGVEPDAQRLAPPRLPSRAAAAAAAAYEVGSGAGVLPQTQERLGRELTVKV